MEKNKPTNNAIKPIVAPIFSQFFFVIYDIDLIMPIIIATAIPRIATTNRMDTIGLRVHSTLKKTVPSNATINRATTA
jgi:hypothetical protein